VIQARDNNKEAAMYGFVLQDWITIRGATAGTPAGDIIQGESTWMGFSSFQDIVVWLDVRETNVAPTGQTLTWYFETSPSKDNNLFTSMGNVALNNTYTPGVQALTKVILASSPSVPLATWVRWRLSPSGSVTTPWDATFRVLVAANRVVRGAA
jgi:hypothetical protein